VASSASRSGHSSSSGTAPEDRVRTAPSTGREPKSTDPGISPRDHFTRSRPGRSPAAARPSKDGPKTCAPASATRPLGPRASRPPRCRWTHLHGRSPGLSRGSYPGSVVVSVLLRFRLYRGFSSVLVSARFQPCPPPATPYPNPGPGKSGTPEADRARPLAPPLLTAAASSRALASGLESRGRIALRGISLRWDLPAVGSPCGGIALRGIARRLTSHPIPPHIP